MPICEADPWRLQYFENAVCPLNLNIPTEDYDAWVWYPKHRWVYDKIAIALSQELEAAPHGVTPPRFPMFSKPIVNLRGMGVGSRVLNTANEYAQNLTAGHMWMTRLEGAHVSSDVAVVRGRPCWWRHVTGTPGREGTFDYWAVHARADAGIEEYCGAWIAAHLADYTGILNVETIGGRIIEAHLRMSDQWPDLYGAGWVEAVIRLYAERVWDFADRDRRAGYSVVLFGPHGRHYHHPPAALIAQVRDMPEVSSVQITFHEERPSAQHAMPPGGFRLAVVNAWSLPAGLAAREALRVHLLARAA
jgi:hypothetical protein